MKMTGLGNVRLGFGLVFSSLAACAAVSSAHSATGRRLADEFVTSEGTFYLAEDIAAGATSSNPTVPVEFDGKLFFGADDSITGSELWSFDGTNLVLEADMWGDGTGGAAGGSNPETQHAAVFQGALYFPAKFGGESGFDFIGRELVRFDGETAELVGDLYPGSMESRPRYLTVVGDNLYFSAVDATAGEELWRYDGVNPPAVVADIAPGPASSIPRHLVEMNGKLYFYAGRDDAQGGEVFEFDPATDTFGVVADIHVGGGWSFVQEIHVHNGYLYIAANNYQVGHEVWTWSPTYGLNLAKDTYVGSTGSMPRHMTSFAGGVFYAGTTATEGRELRVFPPADLETIVQDLVIGTGSSNPSAMTDLDGRLYVIADGSNGREMYVLDGTGELVRLTDFVSGSGSSFPEDGVAWVKEYNGRLYFSATNGESGYELWGFQASSEPACLAGTYIEYNSLGYICEPCAAGTYSPTDGASGCLTCPAGTYSELGSDGCTPCEPGTASTAGQGECGLCPVGEIVVGVACEPCPAGTYENGTRTECLDCSAGSYSAAGADECTACDPGYVSGDAAESCTPCDAGEYEDDNVCVACGSGEYSSSGSDECETCPAGTYSIGTGCQACAPGFVSGAGADSCDPCEAGEYANGDASECVACPSGSFSGDEATSCTACPAETYVTPEADGCVPCNALSSTGGQSGQTACTMCAVGTGFNGVECEYCGVGTYQPTAVDGDACIECPADSSSNVTGATSIDSCICNQGFYDTTGSSSDGSVTCEACFDCVGNLVYERAPCTPTQKNTCSSRIYSSWPRRTTEPTGPSGQLNAPYMSGDPRTTIRTVGCDVAADFVYYDSSVPEGETAWFRIVEDETGDVVTTFFASNGREIRIHLGTELDYPREGTPIQFNVEFYNDVSASEPDASSGFWTSSAGSYLVVEDACVEELFPANVVDTGAAGAATGELGALENLVDAQRRTSLASGCDIALVVSYHDVSGPAQKSFRLTETTGTNYKSGLTLSNGRKALVLIDGNQSPFSSVGEYTFELEAADGEGSWTSSGTVEVGSVCLQSYTSATPYLVAGYPADFGGQETGPSGELSDPYDGLRAEGSCSVELVVAFLDTDGADSRRFRITEQSTATSHHFELTVDNGQVARVSFPLALFPSAVTDLEFQLYHESREYRGNWIASGDAVGINGSTIFGCVAAYPAATEVPGSRVLVLDTTTSNGELSNPNGILRDINCDVILTISYNDVDACEVGSVRQFAVREQASGITRSVSVPNGQQVQINMGGSATYPLASGPHTFELLTFNNAGTWTVRSSVDVEGLCVDSYADEHASVVVPFAYTPPVSHDPFLDYTETTTSGLIDGPWGDQRAPAKLRIGDNGICCTFGTNDDTPIEVPVWVPAPSVGQVDVVSFYWYESPLVEGDVVVRVAYNDPLGEDYRQFALSWTSAEGDEVRRVSVGNGKQVLVRLNGWTDGATALPGSVTVYLSLFNPDHVNADSAGWATIDSFTVGTDIVPTYPSAETLLTDVPNYHVTTELGRIEQVLGADRSCEGDVLLRVHHCDPIADSAHSRSFAVRSAGSSYATAVWVENCKETVVRVPSAETAASSDTYTLSSFDEASSQWVDSNSVTVDTSTSTVCNADVVASYDDFEDGIDSTGVVIAGLAVDFFDTATGRRLSSSDSSATARAALQSALRHLVSTTATLYVNAISVEESVVTSFIVAVYPGRETADVRTQIQTLSASGALVSQLATYGISADAAVAIQYRAVNATTTTDTTSTPTSTSSTDPSSTAWSTTTTIIIVCVGVACVALGALVAVVIVARTMLRSDSSTSNNSPSSTPIVPQKQRQRRSSSKKSSPKKQRRSSLSSDGMKSTKYPSGAALSIKSDPRADDITSA